jgi:hypothetical protein
VVRRLFSHRNACLIGMPTGAASGYDVLDIDPRHDGDQWEVANAHRLPATRIHDTQHAGRHLLFEHAPGVCNDAGTKIAPGVDVRGEGGYVIIPPSPGYRVIHDAPPAHWPDWLLELVLPKSAEPRRVRSSPPAPISDRRLDAYITSLLDNVRRAPEGQKHFVLRNAALALGGVMEQAGISEAHAINRLLSALPRTVEDWKGAEVTAAWGLRAGRERPIELEERPPPRTNGKDHDAPPGSQQLDAEGCGSANGDADAQAEIARLARLPLLQYARQRAGCAKMLSIRVTLLDRLVRVERGDEIGNGRQGAPLDLEASEPWPAPMAQRS